jgi:6-phospho-3-hexuloisomerase
MKRAKKSEQISIFTSKILLELKVVLSDIKQSQIDKFIKEILLAEKIVIAGAGRVGMAGRGFAMRLGHLGLRAYMFGDATVPSLGEKDLLILCSGSGETQTIYDLGLIGKKNRAKIALITGNKNSRMGKIANVIVELKAPSKTKKIKGFTSVQPMTTLNEQSLQILFDAIILQMMEHMQETHETMWARHSNLE